MSAPTVTKLPPALLSLLLAVPAMVVVGFGVASVWPFFSDDAFISLRYSERLVAGHGLTWTDGERVEGYSNLLWVLLCSGLTALGCEAVAAARALGAIATALALWTLAHAARSSGAAAGCGNTTTALLAIGTPVLAASGQVAGCWTCAGLEGPLVLLWLSLAFAAVVRAGLQQPPAQWSRATLLRISVPLVLLCWTRPDGPLWALALGIGLFVCTLSRGLLAATTAALWLGLLPLLGTAAQLLFRLSYYGDLVPNTAHVKAELDPASWPAGASYLWAAVQSHPGLFAGAALAAVGGLLARPLRPLAFLLLLPTLAFGGYLVLIGGDHFPGRRQLHGALAPLALLASLLPLLLLRWGRRAAAAAAAMLLLLAKWNHDAAADGQRAELQAEVWEWRGKQIGEELQRAFVAEQPLLAVDAAGALPFYSRLPALDLIGLCDKTIATTPAPAWLATMRPGMPRPPGHMRGNGRYVMDRAPDLMLFSSPPGLPLPVFVSAAEFEDDPRFLQQYRCVLLDLGKRTVLFARREHLVSPLWVRLWGRAGVVDRGDHIDVPGWLFGSHRLEAPVVRRHQLPTGDAADAKADASLAAIAAWFSDRSVTAEVPPTGPWQLCLRQARPLTLALPLPPGEFRCELEPTDAPFRVRVEAGGSLTGDKLTSDGGDVRLLLVPVDGVPLPARLQRLRLHR